MMRATLASVGALGFFWVATAEAAPLPRANPQTGPALVEKTQVYRRDCVWVNNGWHYRRGGAYVVCRPYRPGRGWVWHREGNRYGWWHPRRHVWHYREWH